MPAEMAADFPSEVRQFVENMNEIILLVSEDRTIAVASDLANDLWGDESRGIVGQKIDKMFPKIYLDAIFARMEKNGIKKAGLTFEIENSKGKKHVLETHFNWSSIGGRDFLALTCRDIDGYLSTISALAESEERYKSLFHEASLGFVHVNSDGFITDCNMAFLEIFHVFRDEVIGVCLAEGGDFGAYPEFTRAAMDAIKGVSSRHEKHFLTSTRGFSGWLRVSFSPVMSDNRTFLGAVGVVEDITEQRQIAERVSFISSHDALTGLLNRRSCENAILEGLGNQDDLPLGILYADLNSLKLANDAFGHAEGDKLLKAATSILRDTGDQDDPVFRWGGDEFIILFKKTSGSAVRERMRRIRSAMREWNGDGFVRPSLAMGFALKKHESEDIADTLKAAEEAMYKDKLSNEKKTRLVILNALENSLYELCDGRLGLRSDRMARISGWIAEICNLSEQETRDFAILCRYHDIGMLSVAEELSVIQRDVSKEINPTLLQHPAVGYRIARYIPEIAPVAEMILAHHEWWNGEGYPNQRRGEKIPLLSRVVSILDALEGMVTLRPEGLKFSLEEALAAIESCAGKRYDPKLVKIITERMRAEPQKFVVDQVDQEEKKC